MKTPIRVLIIEDSESDRELLLFELKRGGYDPEYRCIETQADMEEALEHHQWDIILSDYSLPQFNGLKALEIAKKRHLDIPFILISGTIGEEMAVNAMKEGVSDYLMKGNIKRLIPTIGRELKDAERRRLQILAEKALKESELRFRTLAESSPVGVFTTDAHGYTNYVNPRWCEISKLAEEEAFGDGWLVAVHPEDAENLALNWGKRTSSSSSSKAEYRFLHPDGSVVWVIGQAVPQKDEKGNILGYVGTITDITDRKTMEADLIAAKEKAEESDRLKTAFLHNISHEIRTPLNSIMGFSKLITVPDTSQKELNRYAEIIEQCTNKLVSIISDIMQISAIETGQAKIRENAININQLCQHLHEQFDSVLLNPNITLAFSAPLSVDKASIMVDEEKLDQVLGNLIRNALKFTKEGEVSFGYQAKGSVLEFFVEDTGIGIAPEMHQEIFKRFRQVESSVTRNFGGSGLGLAISKANIELMGGRIWVESELGKGAKFCFTIPYKPVRT